jgi:hypothetical protein
VSEDLFFALSIALTGFPDLHRPMAAGLLARLQVAPEAAELPRLLSTYQGILAQPGDQHAGLIRTGIMDDDALRGVARMVVALWYTGELLSKQPSPLAEDHHFQAVVWRAARAHPPGLSGGYFGHWTYPPDN